MLGGDKAQREGGCWKGRTPGWWWGEIHGGEKGVRWKGEGEIGERNEKTERER